MNSANVYLNVSWVRTPDIWLGPYKVQYMTPGFGIPKKGAAWFI